MRLAPHNVIFKVFLTSCLLSVVPLGHSARADVTGGGLGTRVNGRLRRSCSVGQCKITGGTDVGINRFHRLRNFDTRGTIKGVDIDSGRQRNLVIGVTSPIGSFIDKKVSLSSPAHLFILSPGGIHLGAGAGFFNAPQLTLSTSNRLHFSRGFFDVNSSTEAQLGFLDTSPLPGALGLQSTVGFTPDQDIPGIQLDGIDIRLDKNLLVDAPGGEVRVSDSQISVGDPSGQGGVLTVTGAFVEIDGDAPLSASGGTGGGTIPVGGTWHKSDS